MQHNQWLSSWHTTAQRTITRQSYPDIQEEYAIAAATERYASAVSHLADELQNNQDDPEESARALATTAAVLDHHLSTVHENLEEITHEHLLLDDHDPENLRAQQRLQNARDTSDAVTEAARAALEAQGIPLTNDHTKAPEIHELEDRRRQYKRSRQHADTATAAGNAAALKYLILHLHDLDQAQGDERDTETIEATILAMWPYEEHIILNSRRGLPKHAKQQRKEIRNLLDEHAQTIENNRPIYISRAARSFWLEGAADELTGELQEQDPQNKALFTWEDETPHLALMAYRHEGCTQIKLVNEPYHHSIRQQEALSHCNDLENQITTYLDPEEEEGAETHAVRTLLQTAAVNRTLALLNQHIRNQSANQKAIQTALAHGTPVQAKKLINALYYDQAQAVETAAKHTILAGPHLSPEQSLAALQAAKDAGASDNALRHTTDAIKAPPDILLKLGIEPQPPIPWEYARNIILETCTEEQHHSQAIWERVANATGWPTSHPNFKQLRKELSDQIFEEFEVLSDLNNPIR